MKLKIPFQGEVVQSVQGRDEGRFYVVVRAENAFVWVADGKKRTLANPKRKNLRHVRLYEMAAADIGVKMPFDASFDVTVAYGLKNLAKKLINQVQSEE